VAMAVLTVARFQSLSRKARIMGLFFAGLSMVGLCMALVIGFPWQMLGIAAVSTAGWASMKWRRRVRSRRSEALLSPHVGVGTDKARHTEG
jgi:membrane protein implicated in regulation of membrane protease activity